MVTTVAYGHASLIAARLDALAAWAAHLGFAGMLVFVGAYVAATICFLPGSVLKFGAGLAFGLLRGALVVSAGSTLGAAAAFLIARGVARGAVRRRIAHRALFRALDGTVHRQDLKLVLLLRLCPVVPVAPLNYLFGLTSIGFWPYLAASWLGMLPGTLFYVYLGDASRAGLDAAARHGATVLWLVYVAAGLLVATLVAAQITRWTRQEVRAMSGPPGCAR